MFRFNEFFRLMDKCTVYTPFFYCISSGIDCFFLFFSFKGTLNLNFIWKPHLTATVLNASYFHCSNMRFVLFSECLFFCFSFVLCFCLVKPNKIYWYFNAYKVRYHFTVNSSIPNINWVDMLVLVIMRACLHDLFVVDVFHFFFLFYCHLYITRW